MMRCSGRRPAGDEGVALITVMGAMLVLSMFLLVALNTAIGAQKRSRSAQDSNSATAAVQAGVDDFLQQMNLNTEYLSTIGSAWTAWQQVQGTITDAEYRYRVVNISGNNVLVQSQGRSSAGRQAGGRVDRTAYATYSSRGFLNYVYLSDIEVVDPALVGSPAACGNHYQETPDSNSRRYRSDCAEIQWAGGDVVNGPLHSNDALQVQGAVQFRSPTTETSWPGAENKTGLDAANKTWWGGQAAPLPASYPPLYAPSLDLPLSNTSLLDYVQPNVNGGSNPDTATARPGCYYQGATRIVFTGTTMKVLSPGTTRSDTPRRCYDPSTPNTEQTVAIPQVIYLDQLPAATACTTGAVGYPAAGERYTNSGASATSSGHTTNYECHRGSAYVSGIADARVTVNAVDDIVITGNLQVQDLTSSSNDVVGLIAGNYCWVYNPLSSGGANLLSAATRVSTIQAGILALRHSFVVQNWDNGATIGTLNVTGAIAQKFRGPVGTGNSGGPVTGYVKNYVHDSRLTYLRPPYFLQPVNNSWALKKAVFK